MPQVSMPFMLNIITDCIDLNTLEDTWYVFPEHCDFSVTKISLATEEIFNEIWRQRNEKRKTAKAEE